MARGVTRRSFGVHFHSSTSLKPTFFLIRKRAQLTAKPMRIYYLVNEGKQKLRVKNDKKSEKRHSLHNRVIFMLCRQLNAAALFCFLLASHFHNVLDFRFKSIASIPNRQQLNIFETTSRSENNDFVNNKNVTRHKMNCRIDFQLQFYVASMATRF